MISKLKRFFASESSVVTPGAVAPQVATPAESKVETPKPEPAEALLAEPTPVITPTPTPEQLYAEYVKKRWPKPASEGNQVVLVSMINVGFLIHAQAALGNFLAERYKSRLATASFINYRNAQLDQIYTSINAPIELGFHLAEPFKEKASRDAQEYFSRLESRKDVLSISRKGIALGDLIYDTYLRVNYRGTVDIFDPALKEMIEQSLLMFDICYDYLSKNDVKAYITSAHEIFLYDGLLERLCQWNGIPSFTAATPDPLVIRLNDCDFLPGPTEDFGNWPGRQRSRTAGTIAASLSPAHREKGIRWAQETLEDRLSGKPEYGIIPGAGGSVYQAPSKERLMLDRGRPRILVMLHDFCDGAHWQPMTDFDDFYDWTAYTLERASKTPFDWYVKPHPLRLNESHDSNKIDQLSFELVAEFQRRFPRIRFLSPECSNRQLMQEGVSAMFTLHGTASFEFAYYNMPVVVAGICPQTQFNFNITPRTLSEYDHCIANADQLKVNVQKDEVFLAYFISHLSYDSSLVSKQANLSPAGLIDFWGGQSTPEYFYKRCSFEYLGGVVTHQTPEHDKIVQDAITAYIEVLEKQVEADKKHVLMLRSGRDMR